MTSSVVSTTERWSIHSAQPENDEELLALFQKVFNHDMPIAQWRWKYTEASTRGMLLRRDKTVVAFFGGMPRQVHGPFGMLMAVQNGDVMVLPSERGVFSRKGALHHVAAAFFEKMVGNSHPYEFAFGFPNGRHFKLGIKLGLYAAAGRMMQLTWSALTPTPPRWTIVSKLATNDLFVLESLWTEMRRSWPRHFIPFRDAARWTTRFACHPVNHYDLLVIRRRWTGKALCAVALKEHDDRVEWLDYVGAEKSASLAVAAVRSYAGERNKKPVMALFSESIASSFTIDTTSSAPSDIYIPVNARPAEESRPYIGQLWLMGGDTDFL